jgi:hypothetical protein
VVGYGIGPLFLAPITEIPQIGRNLPYIIPLAIFCLLQIPTALVENFAGFCVLRFIAGFVSSPPLATGGESFSFFPLYRPLRPLLLLSTIRITRLCLDDDFNKYNSSSHGETNPSPSLSHR